MRINWWEGRARNRKLTSVLTVPNLLISISFTLLVFIFSFGIYVRSLSRDFDARTNLIQKLFIDNVTPLILSGQDTAIYSACKKMIDAEGVASVVIRRNDESLICDLGSARGSEIDAESKENAVLFGASGSVAAIIRIAFDRRDVRAAAGWTLLMIVGVFFLMIIIQGAVYFFLGRRLSEPINSLAQIVAMGNLSQIGPKIQELPDAQVAEINVLRDSIFKMTAEVIRLKKTEIAAARDRVLGDMAAQLSHDIRSPLSAINLAISKISAKDDVAVNIVLKASARLGAISNDLLGRYHDLSSQDHVSSEIELSRINMRDLIYDLLEEKKNSYHGRSVATITFDGESCEDCLASGPIVSRILSNLLNNAVEATSEIGEIQVKCQVNAGYMETVIRDNGSGIPAEQMKLVGTKGFSFGKQHGESGFGLGLNHAIEMAKKMGGFLKIESSQNEYTQVTLGLKLASLVADP